MILHTRLRQVSSTSRKPRSSNYDELKSNINYADLCGSHPLPLHNFSTHHPDVVDRRSPSGFHLPTKLNSRICINLSNLAEMSIYSGSQAYGGHFKFSTSF